MSTTLDTCWQLRQSVLPSLVASADVSSLVCLADSSALLLPACISSAFALLLPPATSAPLPAAPRRLPLDPLACPASRDPQEDPQAAALALAVRLGCVRSAEWICGRNAAVAVPGEQLVAACAAGRPLSVAWVARRFALGPALSPCLPEALRAACARGSVACVQALSAALALPRVDCDLAGVYYDALEAACEGGRHDAAAYLVAALALDDPQFRVRLVRAAGRAIAKGHLGLALLLYRAAHVPDQLAAADLIEAAYGGHEEVVRWALETSLPKCLAVAEELFCACAAHCGTELLLLVEQLVPQSEDSAYSAALRCCHVGNVEAFQHIITRYKSPRFIDRICQGSALEYSCNRRSWSIVHELLSMHLSEVSASCGLAACCLIDQWSGT
eukprot:m51a1_g6400 hypothetical protein (387) ;mRNA; r:222448-227220